MAQDRLRFAWIQIALTLGAIATSGISQSHADIVISPTVDGFVRDGLDRPKDGVPDDVFDHGIVQILDTNRSTDPFEDRGIIEFDISGVSDIALSSTLQMPVFASNGPFPFDIHVFAYTGDGSLTLSDFNLGDRVGTFSYSGDSLTSFDVSLTILNAQLSGDQYVGFNLRYATPSPISQNGPFVAYNSLEYGPAASLNLVTAVPEPSAASLFAAVCGFLCLQRRRASFSLRRTISCTGVRETGGFEVEGLSRVPGDA